LRFAYKVLAPILITILLIVTGDVLTLSPGSATARSYMFSIASWEIKHFPNKWMNLLWESWPGNKPSRQRRLQIIDEYLEVSLLANKERERIEGNLPFQHGSTRSTDTVKDAGRDLGEHLDQLVSKKMELKNAAEEAVESELSTVIANEGFGSRLGLIFPPADLAFSDPPTVLVTSPRDRIFRLETLLLAPDISAFERNIIEEKILENYDLSSLVVDLSGLSTYPTITSDQAPLRAVLQTAAHEWLHAYLFFKPLGFRHSTSEEMYTLNETVADLAGRELGDTTFVLMGGDLGISSDRFQAGEDRFPRFTSEMRETRREVDRYLQNGQIEEAENYMKERWWFLALRGYRLRKLNQAYFAFYNMYGQSSVSISPIGDQVKEFRSHFLDTGSFVRAISGVSSYAEFLNLLESYKDQEILVDN
jgi:hypothetical protein